MKSFFNKVLRVWISYTTSLAGSRPDSMLGIVYLDGMQHAIVPQHPRFDHHNEEYDQFSSKDEEFEFDEDSDVDDV